MNLIVVGKLKDKSLEKIESGYLKRIKNPSLKIFEVKAKADNQDLEGSEVIKKIASLSNNPTIILLTEFGESFYSPDFSKWLYQKLEINKDVFFVICGANGPSLELKTKSHAQLSLGKITLPHKIARIVLVEQIYRAQTIHTGHPYHN